jgi:hypothetical protein
MALGILSGLPQQGACQLTSMSVMPSAANNSSRIFTTNEGSTSENYITYLDLDGTESIELPLTTLGDPGLVF